MNKYVKEYLHRGLLFGGFGPIIAGIVFIAIQLSGVTISLDGVQVFVAVVSTYLLAFTQAGASVFNQIERWGIARSVAAHFISIYTVYLACYLINRWLPLRWDIILLFTGIFLLVYAVIWLTVYLIVRRTSRNLNKSMEKFND